MRFRLGYALELVVVLASGMALSRWASWSQNAPPLLVNGSASQSFGYHARAFLAGISLAGGLGLGVELARRRSPPVWGIGRRTWSVAALAVLFGLIDGVGTQAGFRSRYFGEGPSLEKVAGLVLHTSLSCFSNQTTWVFAAIGLTSLVAGQPGDPSPDAREWAGRSLWILIVGMALIARLLLFIR